MSRPYKIEKNVPIVTKVNNLARPKYPFEEMVVGDSFKVSRFGKAKRKIASRLGSAARDFVAKNHPDWKFSVRQVEDGVRVWRVK